MYSLSTITGGNQVLVSFETYVLFLYLVTLKLKQLSDESFSSSWLVPTFNFRIS